MFLAVASTKLCRLVCTLVFLILKENEAVQLRHDDASHEAVTLCSWPSHHFPDHLRFKLWSKHSLAPGWTILRADQELQCLNGRLTEGIQSGSWKEGRMGGREEGREEAAQGGRCPSTDGGGKQRKQGGLTHKNREDSFTKPGGVMEDSLKSSRRPRSDHCTTLTPLYLRTVYPVQLGRCSHMCRILQTALCLEDNQDLFCGRFVNQRVLKQIKVKRHYTNNKDTLRTSKDT